MLIIEYVDTNGTAVADRQASWYVEHYHREMTASETDITAVVCTDNIIYAAARGVAEGVYPEGSIILRINGEDHLLTAKTNLARLSIFSAVTLRIIKDAQTERNRKELLNQGLNRAES